MNKITIASAMFVLATLAACATAGSIDGPQARAPLQCYWLSNVTNAWQAMPEVETRQQCYELDSCSGGLGYSGGGCYKWTVGANDPFKRW